jgi:hypothetical protein
MDDNKCSALATDRRLTATRLLSGTEAHYRHRESSVSTTSEKGAMPEPLYHPCGDRELLPWRLQ